METTRSTMLLNWTWWRWCSSSSCSSCGWWSSRSPYKDGVRYLYLNQHNPGHPLDRQAEQAAALPACLQQGDGWEDRDGGGEAEVRELLRHLPRWGVQHPASSPWLSQHHSGHHGQGQDQLHLPAEAAQQLVGGQVWAEEDQVCGEHVPSSDHYYWQARKAMPLL